jgi:hypothetical protein
MMIQFEKIRGNADQGQANIPASNAPYTTQRDLSFAKFVSAALEVSKTALALLYMLLFILVTGGGSIFAVSWFLFF